MDCHSIFKHWCENVTDPQLQEELSRMAQQNDEAAIEDAFYRNLEFGTAGLRGVLGAGTNRMNIYTVGQATQGIADYINTQIAHLKQADPSLQALSGSDSDKKQGSVAICYDSRINSELFARTAASVLAANGIKSYLYPRLEPTPALSFATRYLGCDMGINVTASHNPSQYNGYKAYGPDGCQIASDMADAITECINQVDIFDDVSTMPFDQALEQGLIVMIGEEVLDAYLDAVYEQHVPQSIDDPLRVVYTPLNGTGLECVTRILKRIGVEDIHVVEEQAHPDGHFPTCPYPNPENRDALERGIALCEEVHPDLLLATDPDADRVGIAVKDGDGYKLLSGNEVGVLLLDFICRSRISAGTMPSNPVAVTTIVSSSMVDPIAQHYGVEIRRVLTGFKYIGGVIADLEKDNRSDDFIFGFEESYGYLAGTHARDKDAVVASMLICQMARYYRGLGKNLYQAMQDLYDEYGFYHNRTLSFTFEGADGARQMTALMDELRANPLPSIANLYVQKYLDYEVGVNGLPQANVLEFDLDDAHKVIVRPSGTEPKVKVYIFTVGDTERQARSIDAHIAGEMTAYVKKFE